MKEELVIEILKYGMQQDFIERDSLKQHLIDKGFKFTSEDSVFFTSCLKAFFTRTSSGSQYDFKYDSIIHLIHLEQLKEVRKQAAEAESQAKKADRHAFWAIAITLIATLISIGLSLYQIKLSQDANEIAKKQLPITNSK